MGSFATLSINDTQPNDIQHNDTQYWVSRLLKCYAECHCAECCAAI